MAQNTQLRNILTAEAARDATLAAYDSFDDRYLGAKTSNPTLDNDGNALLAGALYYNTVVPEMRLYTGSAWVAAYVAGGDYVLKANNLSDLTNFTTARSNLGLGTVATESTVPVSKGGSGATTLTGVLKGNGTSAFTAATAGTDYVAVGTASTFTTPQRGAITTDNDLSFDLSAGNNFTCTPTGTGTLTFTNHTAGQSGYVLLINSSGYAISAAATTKVTASLLATISAAGTYLISYYDNGTNAYLTASGALA